MTDYSKLNRFFDNMPEPKGATDADHMASRHPHELANQVAARIARSAPKNEVVHVGGLTVVPGQGAAEQYVFEAARPGEKLKPIPNFNKPPHP